jgi:hypothetical protein
VGALAAFAMGMLAGGTAGPHVPAAPQSSVLRGKVTFTADGQQLPDEGAAIAVIPESAPRPDEKASLSGLRPGDPSPGESHPGVAILRDLGGGYARADAAGRFEIRLPDRGRYLVLVISHEKRARSAGEIRTADILKLGPYFENVSDLLAERRYQLTTETVRGERELNVALE